MDLADVTRRLNVTVDGRLDDMRKSLSKCYSETENDPQFADIWAELEAAYHDRASKIYKRRSNRER